MMIPWLTRLPTIAEVRAHGKAYPVQVYEDGPSDYGVWSCFDGVPTYVRLRADDRVWLGDGDELTERRMPGAKWLPCTAEGVPTFFELWGVVEE